MIDKEIKVVLPCHFGLEAVTKREVEKLGYKINNTTDGEVEIICKFSDIPILNIHLRTVERVLIEIAKKECKESDDLFNMILNTNIEDFVPQDGIFLISKCNQDKNSILHSSVANQKTAKKAMAMRLMKAYNTNILTENGKTFNFRLKFNKNVCALRLDTSGDGLHKRGYRIKQGIAPIEETLASSIILLSPFNKNKYMLDPFCGSGTFCIEAAMISHNIAPGLNRAFTSETWSHLIDKNIWKQSFENANKQIIFDNNKLIFGRDIDKNMIDISIENAKRVNVEEYIDFKREDVKDVVLSNNMSYGFIITNPPYGERLEEKENLGVLYKNLKNTFDKLNNWSMFCITSYEEAIKYMGEATKNRKIYNGMIKTYLYQYMGEKPKRV